MILVALVLGAIYWACSILQLFLRPLLLALLAAFFLRPLQVHISTLVLQWLDTKFIGPPTARAGAGTHHRGASTSAHAGAVPEDEMPPPLVIVSLFRSLVTTAILVINSIPTILPVVSWVWNNFGDYLDGKPDGGPDPATLGETTAEASVPTPSRFRRDNKYKAFVRETAKRMPKTRSRDMKDGAWVLMHVAVGLVCVSLTAVNHWHAPLMEMVATVVQLQQTYLPTTAVSVSLVSLALGAYNLGYSGATQAVIYISVVWIPWWLFGSVLVIPGILPLGAVGYLYLGADRLLERVLPQRIEWSHIFLLFVATLLLDILGRTSFLVVLITTSSVAMVLQLIILAFGRIGAEEGENMRPRTSSISETAQQILSPARQAVDAAVSMVMGVGLRFWMVGVPGRVKSAIKAYASIEKGAIEAARGWMESLIAVGLIIVGVTITVSFCIFIPMRLLYNIADLGQTGADAVARYPVWNMDWWQAANHSVPWSTLQVAVEERDLKHWAQVSLQQSHAWVASEGRDILVKFVHQDIFGGAVNESVLVEAIDKVMTSLGPHAGYNSNTSGLSTFASEPVAASSFSGLWQQLTDMLRDRWQDTEDAAAFWELWSKAQSALLDVGPTLGKVFLEVLAFNTGVVFTAFRTMGSTMKSIFDIVLEVGVLFTALISLMVSEETLERRLLRVVTQLIITDHRRRKRFEMAIITCIRRTIRFTIKVPAFHFFFTWFTYQAFGASAGVGACFWAIFAATAVLLAVVPVWLAAVPGALELWVLGFPLMATVFLLMHVLAASRLDAIILMEPEPSWETNEEVQENDRTLSPYMIGLSVYGGWFVMESWAGIVLGPMAVNLLLILSSEIQSTFTDEVLPTPAQARSPRPGGNGNRQTVPVAHPTSRMAPRIDFAV